MYEKRRRNRERLKKKLREKFRVEYFRSIFQAVPVVLTLLCTNPGPSYEFYKFQPHQCFRPQEDKMCRKRKMSGVLYRKDFYVNLVSKFLLFFLPNRINNM